MIMAEEALHLAHAILCVNLVWFLKEKQKI